MNDNQLAILALSLLPQIGWVRFSNLLEVFKSPANILSASLQDLASVKYISIGIANAIKNPHNIKIALAQLKKAKQQDIKIVLYDDPDYPYPLSQCPDKPLALFIKGTIIPQDFNSIAIVGSRNITEYGISATRDFADYFARNGITIISGLAKGVDALAHTVALENGGRTIAVLGNGLAVYYPQENRELQDKIPKNGAVVSEFPIDCPPDKTTFPRRNRIVVGLAKAVLVTEAARNSGALISAGFGAEYGKDVFSVPGSIYSKMSHGAIRLIGKGACAVLRPDEMAHIFGLNIKKSLQPQSKERDLGALSINQRLVLSVINDSQDGVNADAICQKTRLDFAEVAEIIFALEMDNFIESASGQIYTSAARLTNQRR